MPALADAGFHVIAPDQRGYGLTTGSDDRFEADVTRSGMFNLTRDILGLLSSIERTHVDCLVGHDFGSAVAAWCALIRPDLFKRVTLMSAPFAGPPALPGLNTTSKSADPAPSPGQIDIELSQLDPPRTHYHSWYSTPFANHEMLNASQGLRNFMRAYFYVKSADWSGNKPERLRSWAAAEMGRLPLYYVMNADAGMAETVSPFMPQSSCDWLTENDLDVYSNSFGHTGFQGGLNWYRCRTVPEANRLLQNFSGMTINQPSMFLSGRQDWGTYQRPGDLERMRDYVCTDMRRCELIDGAGHWVQQEQPNAVVANLLDFARDRIA